MLSLCFLCTLWLKFLKKWYQNTFTERNCTDTSAQISRLLEGGREGEEARHLLKRYSPPSPHSEFQITTSNHGHKCKTLIVWNKTRVSIGRQNVTKSQRACLCSIMTAQIHTARLWNIKKSMDLLKAVDLSPFWCGNETQFVLLDVFIAQAVVTIIVTKSGGL